MNAYRFNLRIQNLINQVNDDGEVPTAEILEAIDSCNTEIPDRVNDLYRLIRTSKTCSDSLTNEAEYLLSRAKRWATVQENAKAHLLKLLNILHLDNYRTDLCRVTVCHGVPMVETTENFNAENLGSEWEFLLRRSVELDKKIIKERVKKGEPIPSGVQVVSGKDYIRIS